jgi:hypothetical protein
MIETDSALNFEFDSLELICYLVLGIWCFSSLWSMRHALCFFGMAIAFAEISPAGHHLMVHQKLDHLALISALATIKSPCGT